MKTYNINKLTDELRAAGITTHGNCSDTGIVWDDENNEIQERPDVAAILAAHDPVELPVPTVEQRLTDMEDVVKLMIFGG